MKRVLLTGATGFVGRNAIAPLLMKGYEVHAVSTKPLIETRDIRWHRANLLDSMQMEALMSVVRPTHLLHFSWYAEPGKFWKSSENFRWLESSIALLRQFRESGGQRIVMAGTCAEYDWDYGYCSEAVTPRRPATPYGVCKNALHDTLGAYSAEENLSSAWGRIFFLYGPDEHPARLVSSVINALLRGESARCTHGNQLRDFMHVEDVAAAFVALLDSEVEGAVNIASGQPVSLREVVFTIADYLDARDRIHLGAIDAPANDPPLLVGNGRRLLEDVGWSPSYSLDSGLIKTVDWWRCRSRISSSNGY